MKKRKKSTSKDKIKLAGVNYTRQSCGTVTAIRKQAERLRKQGKTARVIKNKKGSGACLYVGPKRKTKARK